MRRIAVVALMMGCGKADGEPKGSPTTTQPDPLETRNRAVWWCPVGGGGEEDYCIPEVRDMPAADRGERIETLAKARRIAASNCNTRAARIGTGCIQTAFVTCAATNDDPMYLCFMEWKACRSFAGPQHKCSAFFEGTPMPIEY